MSISVAPLRIQNSNSCNFDIVDVAPRGKPMTEHTFTFDDDKYLVASCTLEGFIQTEWKLCLIALEHSALIISQVVPAFKRVWSIQLAICSESIF